MERNRKREGNCKSPTWEEITTEKGTGKDGEAT